MRYPTILLFFLIFCFLIISCSDDDSSNGVYDCTFVQNDEDNDGLIDETERATMKECSDDAFTSKEEIEENLIGEWELIGHGEGWLASISQPCGFIVIEEDKLTLDISDGIKDTTYNLTWEIERVENTATTFFRLNTSGVKPYELNVSRFCKKYMYGDATPLDGNMYLYEKVK